MKAGDMVVVTENLVLIEELATAFRDLSARGKRYLKAGQEVWN